VERAQMIKEFSKHIDKIMQIARVLGLEGIDEHFYYDIASVKVYFHGGFDSGKKSLSPQRLIFTNNEFESYVKNHQVSFEELKVTVPYHEEPDLLLMVFNNEEIESYDKKKMNNRKDSNYPTLPLIIFTEDFFHIPQGEVFAYAPIIETLESCTENRAVAFSEEEVRSYNSPFSRYLYCVSFLKRILDLTKIMEDARVKLNSMIIQLYDEKNNPIEFLLRSVWIKQLGIKLNEIDNINNACKVLKEYVFQELFRIQEENKNNVLRRMRYFKSSAYASTFAKDFLLKYGNIISEIEDFTCEVSRNNYINSDYQIVRRKEKTKHFLENVCEFAVIGTFSSGKTTFINTILASKHKLRTSAAHNTAVLLKICKAEEDKGEYSRITFKDKIELDLLEPASTNELAQLYKGDETAKVIGVDRKNQRILIRCRSGNSFILIENEKPIIVTEGQTIRQNDRLTEGHANVHNCRKVNCVSRAELEVLIDEIKAKRLVDVSIAFETENNESSIDGTRAIGVINSLISLANKKESTIDINRLREVGLENCYHMKFTGKYNRNPMEIKLDSSGWRDFCDDGEKEVYIERPECYVFAKEINLFMQSDFLKYCSVIDTPGFGSVTEKHDAISERYLMEHHGILLIMIKIGNQTEKLSMKILLNKVESIYNNNSNLNKQNVMFILNCFSNLTTEEHLISSCRNISRMIVERGFSKNKIFVCNLKNSIEKNEYLDTMFNDFPSYKPFFSSIKREIEEKGMLQNLMQIKAEWEGFFEGKISELKRENRDLVNGNRNRERIILDNIFALEQVKKIQMSSFETLKNKYTGDIGPLVQLVDSLDSKKSWKESKENIFDFLGIIQEIDDYIELDYNKVFDISSKAGIRDNEIPQISNKKKFIIPVETFKALYEAILERSWGIFWFRKHRFRKELQSFLEDEINKSFQEMETEYYKICSQQFTDFKEYCVGNITQRIHTNKDGGSGQNVMEKNQALIKEYDKLHKTWSNLSIHKIEDMKNRS
jgi:hypothetical protein